MTHQEFTALSFAAARARLLGEMGIPDHRMECLFQYAPPFTQPRRNVWPLRFPSKCDPK